MKKSIHCEHCLKELSKDKIFVFDGINLCAECLSSCTVMCDDCGRRFWSRDDRDTRRHLCPVCYESHYNTCARCNALIHDDECFYIDDHSDEPLCEECYEYKKATQYIHDYCYKPYPIFYGNGPRYLGVELEIDCGGENSENAKLFTNLANSKHEHIYCKHDGSLDDGFEIVTHPMTLEYHTKEMPWKSLLDTILRHDYRSHQADTCGLHVHVNRSSLGDSFEEQERTIARILYFFEAHWNELLRFSRRTSQQLNKWAARYGYKEHPAELLDYAKVRNNSGRYCCINLQNPETIEFRIFRGTLKFSTLMATLQTVDKICSLAMCMTDEELKALPWSEFVLGCNYNESIKYLKERRLYVNDVVTCEEEF